MSQPSAPSKALSLPELQQQVEKLDRWNSGLWVALLRLSEALSKAAPQQMAGILEDWSRCEQRYERACQGDRKALLDEPLESVEPSALLARTLRQIGLTPQSLRAAAGGTSVSAPAPRSLLRSPARKTAATSKRRDARK